MPRDLVTPDEFLTRLGQCFSGPSSSGTVWLTHKRYNRDEDEDVKMGDETGASSSEYDVLIRCTQDNKPKFSARIPASRLPEFHTKYGTLLKGSMAPFMRKRDKKKEKAKAEAAAKKKKELYVDVTLGSAGKRGKGRRQRQRKVAAQKKKEAEREKVESRSAAAAAAPRPAEAA
ncbi:hypothetical protein JCM24511_07202 [Saitozyma sp. JCM 24511]|nr:hypothetical protein JCM24511_07202 [Saitozyma sp. JCM 24511]